MTITGESSAMPEGVPSTEGAVQAPAAEAAPAAGVPGAEAEPERPVAVRTVEGGGIIPPGSVIDIGAGDEPEVVVPLSQLGSIVPPTVLAQSAEELGRALSKEVEKTMTQNTPAPPATPRIMPAEPDQQTTPEGRKILVAMGKMSVHQAAAAAFDLEPEHVLSHRDVLNERGETTGVVIVTAGGRTCRWPEDDGVMKLTEPEKDGQPRDTPHRNMTLKAIKAMKEKKG
jgi:hypothetical protein